MSEQTATAIRLERMQVQMRLRIFDADPIARAAAIANHYMAYAHMAKALAELVKLHRYQPTNAPNDVRQVIGEIERAHLIDLGVPLKWPTKPHAEDSINDLREDL